MRNFAIVMGALNAALAIICGAFAAHGLENTLSDRMLEVFLTAADYHLYHSLGLILLGILFAYSPSNKILKIAFYLMLIGMLIFCGSLYALALSGITKFGMITPIGGTAFILSWLLIAAAFIKKDG